jgi:GNAT superfamily N-acetyltransferase
MTTILEANMPDHHVIVHDLLAEYLRWVCNKIYADYKVVFNAESMIVHDMETIDIFLPPKGFVLISYEDGFPSGCVCVRTLAERIAELKRMYVRPAFRGKGIGTKLVQEAVQRIRKTMCSAIRLDSAEFMTSAHRVYRSLGFTEIAPYEGSEIPKEYQTHWVFMELNLSGT